MCFWFWPPGGRIENQTRPIFRRDTPLAHPLSAHQISIENILSFRSAEGKGKRASGERRAASAERRAAEHFAPYWPGRESDRDDFWWDTSSDVLHSFHQISIRLLESFRSYRVETSKKLVPRTNTMSPYTSSGGQ